MNYFQQVNSLIETGYERETVKHGDCVFFKHNLAHGVPCFSSYHYKQVDLALCLAETLWVMKGTDRVHILDNHYTCMLAAHVFEQKDKEDETKTFETTGLGDSVQMRRFGYHPKFCEIGFDQLRLLCDMLTDRHEGSSMVISFWNPNAFLEVKVLPVVTHLQFTILNNKLHMQMHLRHCHMVLEYPLMVMKWALFVHFFAVIFGLELGYLSIFISQPKVIPEECAYFKEKTEKDDFEAKEYTIDYPTLTFTFEEPTFESDIAEIDKILKRAHAFTHAVSRISFTEYTMKENPFA